MRYDRPPLPPTPASAGSPGWRLAFRALYRVLRWLDPLLRRWWRLGLPPLGRSVVVAMPGRLSGKARTVLVTLLVVDGTAYLGHPNGDTAWTRNVEAAGTVEVEDAAGAVAPRRVVRLRAGSERDAVIRATWSQQPFPGSVIYSMARRHVSAVGVYFRLEPVPPGSR
jgi:hypothetical protein